MKDFFKQVCQELHVITGLRQMETLTDEQIRMLIDELVKVSNRFGHFPEEKKKQIIQNSILQDTELKKLTPAKVFQWLSHAWESLDAATRSKYIYKGDTSDLTNDQVLNGIKAQEYIDRWRESLKTIDYTRLEPLPTSKRIMKKELNPVAVKIAQKEIECPRCEGKGCNYCKGFGRIKVTL